MIDVTSFVDSLSNKPVAVLGMGISNVAVAAVLKRAGVTVAAWDDNRDVAGAIDLMQEDLAAYACLVVAPGVPLSHPVVVKARESGIEIICDLEILHRSQHGRTVIGITGTNGKSTTASLLGHILDAPVGGNIGQAVLDMDLPPEGMPLILEVSSFQMDLCPTFTPEIAVHLNISPDHLDRHGSMESYVRAKRGMLNGPGRVVICTDDDWSRKIYEDVKAAGERAVYAISACDDVMAGLDIPTLPGVHNRQNGAAAYEVARLTGMDHDSIIEAMKTFPGLAHRQYLVREVAGVAYVNDSKATNAAAAGRALACYENILWIVGGRSKSGGLHGLEDMAGNVRHAFLIGEAEQEFSGWMVRHGVSHTQCGTLDKAVAAAGRMARAGDTVLLSPACASFDQFSNFEERGDIFTQLVAELKETAA